MLLLKLEISHSAFIPQIEVGLSLGLLSVREQVPYSVVLCDAVDLWGAASQALTRHCSTILRSNTSLRHPELLDCKYVILSIVELGFPD